MIENIKEDNSKLTVNTDDNIIGLVDDIKTSVDSPKVENINHNHVAKSSGICNKIDHELICVENRDGRNKKIKNNRFMSLINIYIKYSNYVLLYFYEFQSIEF